MLAALDFYLGPVTEIVVIGSKHAHDARNVLRSIQQHYLPNAVLLFHDPADGEPNVGLLPQLRGKSGGARVRTYICLNETCQSPMEGVEAVNEWLR